MLVELLCKYNKAISKEALEEINQILATEELIKGSDFDKETMREELLEEHGSHEYGPFTFNLKDVQGFNHIDPEHTCVRFYNGQVFNFKVEYEIFKSVYQQLTSILITSLIAEQNIEL